MLGGLWRSARRATLNAASHATYEQLVTYPHVKIQRLLQGEGVPHDISRIYTDWMSGHRRMTDEVITAVMARGCQICKAASSKERRMAVLKEASEVYLFAQEDMLIVPPEAGRCFLIICKLCDELDQGRTGWAVAQRFYKTIREEKERNMYATRLNKEVMQEYIGLCAQSDPDSLSVLLDDAKRLGFDSIAPVPTPGLKTEVAAQLRDAITKNDSREVLTILQGMSASDPNPKDIVALRMDKNQLKAVHRLCGSEGVRMYISLTRVESIHSMGLVLLNGPRSLKLTSCEGMLFAMERCMETGDPFIVKLFEQYRAAQPHGDVNVPLQMLSVVLLQLGEKGRLEAYLSKNSLTFTGLPMVRYLLGRPPDFDATETVILQLRQLVAAQLIADGDLVGAYEAIRVITIVFSSYIPDAALAQFISQAAAYLESQGLSPYPCEDDIVGCFLDCCNNAPLHLSQACSAMETFVEGMRGTVNQKLLKRFEDIRQAGCHG